MNGGASIQSQQSHIEEENQSSNLKKIEYSLSDCFLDDLVEYSNSTDNDYIIIRGDFINDLTIFEVYFLGKRMRNMGLSSKNICIVCADHETKKTEFFKTVSFNYSLNQVKFFSSEEAANVWIKSL